MAEGILGGILRGEDEKPEVEAPEAVPGVDAFASAVAAKLAGNDPEVARDTSMFLKKQAQLLEIQAAFLKDEHVLRVAHLHNQLREERVRSFGLRLRVGFQILVGLVGLGVALGFVLMIHDAVKSRTVIVESFEISPSLASQSLTGRIVAAGLVDRLAQIQAATRTAEDKRDIADAWSNEINIELPETGLSIGEIERLLKSRFGRDQHISGGLVKVGEEGLELTIRGSGVLPRTFTDAKGDLRSLTDKAGEYAYSQAQPGLWSAYLAGAGRYQELIEFSQATLASASPPDRPVLLTYWGLAIAKTGDRGSRALGMLQRAIALQPDYWYAYEVMPNIRGVRGDEEGVWRLMQDLRKVAGGRPGRAPEVAYGDMDYLTWDLQSLLSEFTADADSHSGAGTLPFAVGPQIALVETWLHDPGAAELALQATQSDSRDPSVAADIQLVRGLLDFESGDSARAVTEMEAFGADYANPAVAWNDFGFNCWVAPIEEAAGRSDRADAVLNTGGTFVDCYRFRGDILDGRGDWRGAQEWYAKCVELAPDLPAGYYSWGVALARHGELAEAEAKLKSANERGPHWADPLKAWGDVLNKQGHRKNALVKYDEALKYAPNWTQLKEARQTLAKQTI